MRRCPRCTFVLDVHRHAVTDGHVELDVCPRCKGAWLDAGDAARALGDNAEVAAWERTSAARLIGKSKLPCPLGHGPLSAYALRVDDTNAATELEIDACPVCNGMWLDAWEATRLQRATAVLPVAPGAAPHGEQRTGVGWYLFQLFSGLPVEEYNPVRSTPWVVWALIVANAVAFVVEFAQPDLEGFVRYNGLVPSHVVRGVALHALVTHMFLHGGLMHIIGNMYFLKVFGDNIEDRVGRLRFAVLYLAFGLAAAASQLLMSLGSDVPMVGASGAISGLLGAYLMLFPKTRLWVVLFFVRFRVPVFVYLGIWGLLQGLYGMTSMKEVAGVAYWAHLGGFCAGCAWGLLRRGRYGTPSR